MHIDAVFSLKPPYLNIIILLSNLYLEIITRIIKLKIKVLILYFFNLSIILCWAIKNPLIEFGTVEKNLP